MSLNKLFASKTEFLAEKKRLGLFGEDKKAFTQPNVYTIDETEEKKEYVCFWNGDFFEDEFVEKFISNLEDVRISNSYSSVKIYFNSHGGSADVLMMVASFLNNYELPITLVINGHIASCGSLLPMMLEDVEIEFTPTSSAMFHFAYNRVYSSHIYNSEATTIDQDAFSIENTRKLNEYLYDNFYSKLKLTEEEMEHIKKGKDVYITGERLVDLYGNFKDRQYFENGFNDDIAYIDSEINIAEQTAEILKQQKQEMIDERAAFFREDAVENCNESEDEYKIGLTD